MIELEQRDAVSSALKKVWPNDVAAAKAMNVSRAELADAVANQRVLKHSLWTPLSQEGLRHGNWDTVVMPPPFRLGCKRAAKVRALPKLCPVAPHHAK